MLKFSNPNNILNLNAKNIIKISLDRIQKELLNDILFIMTAFKSMKIFMFEKIEFIKPQIYIEISQASNILFFMEKCYHDN
jgi:hypothetical protein